MFDVMDSQLYSVLLYSWEQILRFFEQSDMLQIVAIVFLSCFGGFWFISVIWVLRDSVYRSKSLLFHALSVCLATLLPFIGAIIYIFLRPLQTLAQSHIETMELQALESTISCHVCSMSIEKDHVFCSHCGSHLLKRCRSCLKKQLKMYKYCVYCGLKH